MAEGEEDNLSWLSLKDFEDRDIKIDPNWTGNEALAAVARLASEKLEEGKIRKEKDEKERKFVKGDWYWSKLAACNGYNSGSSSRSFDDRREWLLRVSERNEREKSLENPVRKLVPDIYSRKGMKFVAASANHGSSPGGKDNWREKEKALKKPVRNTDLGLCSKKKRGFNVASRDKLLADAMKSRIMAWKDHYDEEWEAEYTKKEQKLKKSISRRNISAEKHSKSNKEVKRRRYVAPNESPDLPIEYRERIEKLNGSKINLVIQKGLYFTDISGHHGRLSLPLNQILSIPKFLNDDERNEIDINLNEKVAMLIEPSLKVTEITLTRWPKKTDKFSYVLTGKWNDVRKENDLAVGDIIQVWSFRIPGDQLCFAFVIVSKVKILFEENNQNVNSSEGAGNCSSDHVQNQSLSSEVMNSNTTQASNPPTPSDQSSSSEVINSDTTQVSNPPTPCDQSSSSEVINSDTTQASNPPTHEGSH